MVYKIEILRRKHGEKPYKETFVYEPVREDESVATALQRLNERDVLLNADGKETSVIEWECSCLQKKCGACAMVVNGVPKLACSAKLSDYKKGEIRLEPLRKFPVIADLTVDRTILHENLKTIQAWFDSAPYRDDKRGSLAFEASRCLQCGCCLDVCPNFYAGGEFYSMSVCVPTTKLLCELPKNERDKIAREYAKHVYNGCGKALSCKNVCPAGIETDEMLVNSNAMAIWKRK